MRAFVVMCCLALASAGKLGYNYPPVAHSDSGLSFSPGSFGGRSGGHAGGLGAHGGGSAGRYGGHSGGSAGGLGGHNGGLGGLGGGLGGIGILSGGLGRLGGFDGSLTSVGGLSGGFGGLSGSSSSSSLSSLDDSSSIDSDASSSSSSVGDPAEVGWEKEFYTFSADDSAFDEPEAYDQISHTAKKNLRVIFIKGPENNALENAVVNLARHASEQKTSIYVLQKQASLSDLANKLQASQNVRNHQPDVHFVKYRTPEDAANAQKAIQAQYDQLGGSSHAHDGGVAPVHNFASPAARISSSGGDSGASGGVSDGAIQGGGISGGSGSGSPSATYLPAAIRRV